jgi:hypothetical protein
LKDSSATREWQSARQIRENGEPVGYFVMRGKKEDWLVGLSAWIDFNHATVNLSCRWPLLRVLMPATLDHVDVFRVKTRWDRIGKRRSFLGI